MRAGELDAVTTSCHATSSTWAPSLPTAATPVSSPTTCATSPSLPS
uniref:Uncharacterized protein n=1 Tax=Arundo donax TaxID=35708 RepID=A0A0A9QGR9_ARUDO